MQITVALDGEKKRDLRFFAGDDMSLTIVVYAQDGDTSPITVTNVRFAAADGELPMDSEFVMPSNFFGRVNYRIVGEVADITTTLAYGVMQTEGEWPTLFCGCYGSPWPYGIVGKAENITLLDAGNYFDHPTNVEAAIQHLASTFGGEAAQEAAESASEALAYRNEAQAASATAVAAEATTTAARDATVSARDVSIAASNSAVVARDDAEGFAEAAATSAAAVRVEASWAALSVIVGAVEGEGSIVRGDAGVHTDPVSSALVANSGQYRWDDTANVWQWVSADPAMTKADKVDLNAAENKLVSLYESTDTSKVPMGGVTNPAGQAQAVVYYSLPDQRVLVNGVELPDQRMLGDQLYGQYIPAGADGLIPIGGVTNPAGEVQMAVHYDLSTMRLMVNGTAAGGLPLTYAPPEGVSAAQTPVTTAVMHLMSYGQSLSKGFNSIPPHSTAQPYNNLTFAQGPKSTKSGSVGLLPGMDAFIPLIENTLNGDGVASPQTGETPCSAWANGLTRRLAIEGEDWRTSGRQFLGSANGKGSASITQLLPGGTTDLGEWFQVVRDAITAAAALSAAASKVYSMPVWIYMQGEGDNANAAYAGGAWRTDLQTMHAAVTSYYQSVAGGTYVPWLGVYQTYARTLRERPHATIDQLDYCETAPNAFHLTAIYHLSLAADGHLSALGSYWVGQYAAKKSRQLLAGQRPQWMRLGVATIRGQVVRYRPREIPVAPLRLLVDEHVRPCTDSGFLVRDDNGTCDIESIGIGPQGDEVVITLVAPTTGDVQLRYGLDYLPAGQVDYSGSAGGNLVDSDPETFDYDSTAYPLINVCPHFQLDVIPV